jgi:hypothetical protein
MDNVRPDQAQPVLMPDAAGASKLPMSMIAI